MEKMSRKKWAVIDKISVVLPSWGEVGRNNHEGRGTIWAPFGGLLEEAAGTVAQTIARKLVTLGMRRKRPGVVTGRYVKMVRQQVVRRVVFLGRLQALAGW